MKKYFLIQFIRNIKRDKTSFFINIIGLSSALVCILLIYLWVDSEYKMDKFHEKDEQLYVVQCNLKFSQGIDTWDHTPAIMAEAMAEEFPEVVTSVAVNDFYHYRNRKGILFSEDKYINAKGLHTGRNFFNVFSFDLLYGDKNSALANKNNIIISEAIAKKLFSSPENSIGKTVKWEHSRFKGDKNYTITGVFKKISNCSFKPFDVIFSLEKMYENDSWTKKWNGFTAQTFLVLKKGIDLENFNSKITQYIGSKNAYYLDHGTIFIQQYSNKYLHGQYVNGIPSGGRIMYVRLFSLIAVFILIIACINYMNLSTAKASVRLKDVGVKKSIGAGRKVIIIQYISESIIISFLSFFIALLLVFVILPQFNTLTRKHFDLFDNINILPIFILLSILIGFLAGSYPALFISGFKPVTILKGKLKTSLGEIWVRKGLVVFQYVLSVVFILGFLTLNKQIKYIQNKNLGYNRDNIICFKWKGKYEFGNNDNLDFKYFISELKKIPGIVNATCMSGNILDNIFSQTGITWTGKDSERDFLFQSPVVGYNFIETLGMEIVDGRSFSEKFNDDYTKIIINGSAVKHMGLKNPVGKTIGLNNGSEIIGVVKDFNYGSLRTKIEPLIFRFEPIGQNLLVKIATEATIPTIEKIKELHNKIFPKYPFEFTFMNDDYHTLYESENKLATLSKYFAILAIIISCLGMFGLSVFNTQKRTKEIGIRKVHGSSSLGIVQIISLDFTQLVIISIIIALPIGYIIMKKWLNGFAYKIDLNWWIFLSTGLITLVISWFTVGMQAIKAARINPAISLKDE